MSDSLFHQFSCLISGEIGIHLHTGKRALLQARLNRRLAVTGARSYDSYYQYITSPEGRKELVHFLDCVATNLTYFFREQQHFDFLERRLIPVLLTRKRSERSYRIRIWSAGCSTGEEPFSLAMTVLSRLQNHDLWDFRILGTDISTRVLKTAARGVYSSDKMEKVPAQMKNQYFQKYEDKNGRLVYEASPLLKRIVTFRRLNLKGRYPFEGKFDFIFCRNVLIYFNKKTQEQIIEKMTSYLAPEGCIFIGHSESLAGLSHPLTYVRPAVYKKGS